MLLPARLLLPALTLAAALVPARAGELSDSDRDALIENLDTLRDAALSIRNERYRTALETFRAAIGNPQKLLQVYYDSVRLVEYDRQNRPGSEYRAWEDAFRENLDKDKLQAKLEYQLRWLLLMMEAEISGDPSALADESLALVRELFADAEYNRGLLGEMSQEVTATVMARAFDLDQLEIEGMPSAPLPLQPVFALALRPAQRAQNYDRMRTLWNERISLEGQIVQNSIGEEEKLQNNPAARQFATITRPNLLWTMEMDCYRAGDERNAAANLLAMLRQSDSTSQALDWEKQLRELVDPGGDARHRRQAGNVQEAAEPTAPVAPIRSRRGRPPVGPSGNGVESAGTALASSGGEDGAPAPVPRADSPAPTAPHAETPTAPRAEPPAVPTEPEPEPEPSDPFGE